MRLKLAAVFLFGATAVPAITAFAQSFDVASVRPMTYDEGARTHISNSPLTSEFKAVNVTLRDLLEVAYSIPETQMLSGPAWAATDKFDLEAKSDTKFNEQLAALSVDQGKEEKRRMLQALLADRFRLVRYSPAS
jgi:uncharacterized protein (TIGR03435 family)